MKRLCFLLTTILLILSLTGCDEQSKVLRSLPDYESEVFYTSDGFQDYTDYAKYTYDSVSVQDLEDSNYFTVTTAKDVQKINIYINNFEEWVKAVGGDLKKNYDFDRSIVTEGDYFYIFTYEGKPIGESTYGKFDNYSVFYFDIDTQTLYYFHNNI